MEIKITFTLNDLDPKKNGNNPVYFKENDNNFLINEFIVAKDVRGVKSIFLKGRRFSSGQLNEEIARKRKEIIAKLADRDVYHNLVNKICYASDDEFNDFLKLLSVIKKYLKDKIFFVSSTLRCEKNNYFVCGTENENAKFTIKIHSSSDISQEDLNNIMSKCKTKFLEYELLHCDRY